MTDASLTDEFDQQHIWHPYAKMPAQQAPIKVQRTQGSLITLANGQVLIDGMSSWWAAIHGYNHPKIMQAMHQQIEIMPHIMFGGLTHQPAIELCKRLVALTPDGLNKVFLSDSGSVAMEVAIKMALQYWMSKKKPEKNRLVSLRHAYHGDTFATMAVCDPDNGMHHLFSSILAPHFFVKAPNLHNHNDDIEELENILKKHRQEIAALTLEPIVQGAGGMRFYRADYLRQAKALCEKYEVLLIADEIATGFGRTGKLFACEWAQITPDILCVGKALTGGNITLAATLCTDEISTTISQGTPGLLMHGPTFMGNPLACATAVASIDLLLASDWQTHVQNIENTLKTMLLPLNDLAGVKEARVLGAIGVVELKRSDLAPLVQAEAIKQGIWLRPFGRLVYVMPAFNIPKEQLNKLLDGMAKAIKNILNANL
ncbi:adenosylmethionine--8-amino-7-oxononanoate transaminase [Thiosulfativibrio zosterae]|uniref:Adenosylmethionine-8-amino-7-oxononanoate aminotransferase n=1 Tax=Thiosulfativibrio zosterae TaxID=2675053 RepID=A0A6F8PKR2_9GAMM|nr:adenosylmethionine--8-amino-7-oxononanoate transaminase [Thiosulfativibrio zosterae]BBP42691.1 hypothetical protein THMIRHAT_04370 [Thiosulfativibrio zosterae]